MNYIMLASRKPCGIKVDGLIPWGDLSGVSWDSFTTIRGSPPFKMTVDVFCIGNISWNGGVYLGMKQLEVSENDLAESLKIHFEKACNP